MGKRPRPEDTKRVSGRASPRAEVIFASAQFSNKPISVCGKVPSLSCHIKHISAGHSWMKHSAEGPLARGVEADQDLCLQSRFVSEKSLSQKACRRSPHPTLPQLPYSPPGDPQLGYGFQAETMVENYRTTEILPIH